MLKTPLSFFLHYAGQGYLKDRKRLKKFFKKKLGYKTFWEGDGFVNVTQEQLLESIENVKLEIQEKANTRKPYDRFAFVILTHGSQVCMFFYTKTCILNKTRLSIN